ncbi:hypothetical protein KIPB_004289 [Kipferlia bialata]|uniref:C2 domain-containing protein n=1 Tax=Kipferlia bialata TaxID=797122 RepID=A0A9K3CU97_9EUKA|nr:hypothetical protein KIPB_004289 [Kipferlia bialata]|eukprot:g4289.t1
MYVRLIISASSLYDTDSDAPRTSNPDPICLVYVDATDIADIEEDWVLTGTTEIKHSDRSPVWDTNIDVPLDPDRPILLKVYDVDDPSQVAKFDQHDFLGQTETSVGALLSAEGQTVTLPLLYFQGQSDHSLSQFTPNVPGWSYEPDGMTPRDREERERERGREGERERGKVPSRCRTSTISLCIKEFLNTDVLSLSVTFSPPALPQQEKEGEREGATLSVDKRVDGQWVEAFRGIESRGGGTRPGDKAFMLRLPYPLVYPDSLLASGPPADADDPLDTLVSLPLCAGGTPTLRCRLMYEKTTFFGRLRRKRRQKKQASRPVSPDREREKEREREKLLLDCAQICLGPMGEGTPQVVDTEGAPHPCASVASVNRIHLPSFQERVESGLDLRLALLVDMTHSETGSTPSAPSDSVGARHRDTRAGAGRVESVREPLLAVLNTLSFFKGPVWTSGFGAVSQKRVGEGETGLCAPITFPKSPSAGDPDPHVLPSLNSVVEGYDKVCSTLQPSSPSLLLPCLRRFYNSSFAQCDNEGGMDSGKQTFTLLVILTNSVVVDYCSVLNHIRHRSDAPVACAIIECGRGDSAEAFLSERESARGRGVESDNLWVVQYGLVGHSPFLLRRTVLDPLPSCVSGHSTNGTSAGPHS